MARRPRGEGGVYQRHDHPSCPALVPGPLGKNGQPTKIRPEHKCRGTWVGNLNLGWRDGTRRRRVVYGRTKSEALRRLAEAKRELATHGDIPTAGMTVAQWMEYWLREIAPLTGKPTKMRGYREKTRNYIIPALGRHRLEKLGVQHVRELHRYITESQGLSPSTAHGAHAVLSVALNDAVREGRAARNVASIVKAPPPEKDKGEAFALSQVLPICHQIAGSRLQSRWLAALLLAARQGEALGTRWDYIDLEAGIVDLSWQLQRISYRHGCGDTCGKRPQFCPARELDIRKRYEYERLHGGLCLIRPKTDESQRLLPLVEPLWSTLRARREAYLEERQAPGYVDHGLVWAQLNGQPIDNKADDREWVAVLNAAGVPHAHIRQKVHAARHTTATVLQAMHVDESTRMMILGHSSATTQRRYAHRDLTLVRQALEQLGEQLSIEA